MVRTGCSLACTGTSTSGLWYTRYICIYACVDQQILRNFNKRVKFQNSANSFYSGRISNFWSTVRKWSLQVKRRSRVSPFWPLIISTTSWWRKFRDILSLFFYQWGISWSAVRNVNFVPRLQVAQPCFWAVLGPFRVVIRCWVTSTPVRSPHFG